MQNINYSILINTCDKFDDCWDPFFKLWSLYWTDCSGRIYLNTEYKDYSYPELDITAVKGCERHHIPKEKRATWSQCLKWALETMDTDIILYMQEDYFLKDTVKNEIIEEYISLMEKAKDIDCIQLTDQAVKAVSSTPYKHLYSVDMHHWSVTSCQASLWKRTKLLELIRDYESAWNFEWWGSKRARILQHKYYVVDPNQVILDKFEIIPYIFTGVVGGKWYKPVVELFKKHNIEMDYTHRGFFERKPLSLKEKLYKKIVRLPIELRSSLDLMRLKVK